MTDLQNLQLDINQALVQQYSRIEVKRNHLVQAEIEYIMGLLDEGQRSKFLDHMYSEQQVNVNCKYENL